MSTFFRDPLVGVLKLILALFLGLLGVSIAALVIGAVVLPFVSGDLAGEIGPRAAALPGWQFLLMLEGMLLGILGLLAIIGAFLLDLWRILGSIETGNPFVPANSHRLTRMAWLALAGNIWALLLAAAGTWLAPFLDETADADIDLDINGGGILLILVLFVLARVFRHGTQLREDAEGVI